MTKPTSPIQHGRADLTVAEQATLAAELGLKTSTMVHHLDRDAAAIAQTNSLTPDPGNPLCIEAVAEDLEQDAAASAPANTRPLSMGCM